jgi:nicotinamide mononucleotide (NMN) deamidase PncC
MNAILTRVSGGSRLRSCNRSSLSRRWPIAGTGGGRPGCSRRASHSPWRNPALVGCVRRPFDRRPPGAPRGFLGGVVAYANDVKVQSLGVPGALLAEHGAVSEPVGRAMAEGVSPVTRCRPSASASLASRARRGARPKKRVGTVVIAVATGATTTVRTLRLAARIDRMVRQHAGGAGPGHAEAGARRLE